MKNSIYSIFILFIGIVSSQAQITNDKGEVIFSLNQTGMFVLNTGEKTKISFEKDELIISDTEGTPFLFKKMQPARIYYEGNEINMPKVNYDVVQDHIIVYYKNKKNNLPLVNLDDNFVQAVNFYVRGKDYFFAPIPSYKFINNPNKYFFEIFTTNVEKAYIIKSYTKERILTHRNNGIPMEDWGKKFRYRLKETYYMKNESGYFVKTKLNKKSVLKKLNKISSKELKKYIKSNKLKLKKPEDIQKLLEYYFSKIS